MNQLPKVPKRQGAIPNNPAVYQETVSMEHARDELAEYLSDPTDTRKLSDFLVESELTSAQVRTWQRDPSFQRHVMSLTLENLKGVFPQLLKSSMARAMRGSSKDFDQLMKLAQGDASGAGPTVNITGNIHNFRLIRIWAAFVNNCQLRIVESFR